MRENRNVLTSLVGKSKERAHLEELGTDAKIIFKRILEELYGRT
jgi:hypothetical protein